MKSIILLIISIITLQANAQYRGLEWGSTKKNAIEKYGNPDVDGDSYIAYNYTLAGKSTLSVFYYKQDKLWMGVYLLEETHSNKNAYIDDYNSFKDLLSKKYGTPTEDETYWIDDLYKDDYSGWGMAISKGDMLKYSTWSDDKTDIECSILGDNYDITCKIRYASIELKDWVEKIDEKENLDDF
tara:strand:+ start:70 stop:621 length:552 start_codon:yes stop_codon:yes gene_type:complete